MPRNFLSAATAVALLIAVGATQPAAAADRSLQLAHDESGQGMYDGHMMGGGMRGQSMTGPGMMMGPGTMHGGMGPGMRGRDTETGMPHGAMHPGMMGSTMRGQGGMGDPMGFLFGRRVLPPLNLSVDDVRGYLEARLERLGNKRLKVGEVKAEKGTITADIVTVDNSLVQRLNVDRSTGAIDYGN